MQSEHDAGNGADAFDGRAQDASASPIDPDDLIENLEGAASFFRISIPTLQTWIKEGAPVRRHGGKGAGYEISLRDLADWRKRRAEDAERREQERATVRQKLQADLLGPDALLAGNEEIDALTPAQRKDMLAAELATLKLARERGELVNAMQVRLTIRSAATKLRDRMMAIPDKVTAALDLGEPVRQAMADEIETLLLDLANELADMESGEAIANAA